MGWVHLMPVMMFAPGVMLPTRGLRGASADGARPAFAGSGEEGVRMGESWGDSPVLSRRGEEGGLAAFEGDELFLDMQSGGVAAQ